jgi:phosphoserine phosphatase
MQGFDPTVAKELIKFVESFRGRNDLRKVATFDADGTLWRGDIGEAFFQHQIERRTIPRAPKRNPWNTYLKESTEGDSAKAYGWLAQWNAGVAEAELNRWCEQFFNEYWTKNVFDPMRELTHTLLNAGFEVWVISGSIRWIVQAGVKGFGIQEDRVLGSSVEVENGVLTDRIEGLVPYRASKAKLIETIIGKKPLFAAGNTFWDKEMLATASEMALAIASENDGEPNHGSEQKLRRHAESVKWLVQRF